MGKSPEKGAENLLYLMHTPNAKLVSGEYYAKSQVTEITKESNDLQMASRLVFETQKLLGEFLNNGEFNFQNLNSGE